jgi:hypothetical protein
VTSGVATSTREAAVERHRSSPSRRIGHAALLVLLLVLLFGFVRRRSQVRPPPPTADSVVVRVLATGLHSGLLLPCGGGNVVEYGYGEWGWYARDESAWWRAPAIALFPSQGAIGRRYVREEDLATTGGKYGGGTLAPVRVPRAAVEALVAKLDLAFATGGEPYHNELYDMDFVKCPARFHLFHECHDATAEWLRELGCDVGEAPIRVGLVVEAEARRP